MPKRKVLKDVESLYFKRPHLHWVDRETDEVDAPDVPIQQDDNQKSFFLGIATGGLQYMYAKITPECGNPMKHYRQKTKNPKHVIIVGAGMSGLASAFELRQVGHKVTVLELQQRVGGRIKTISDPFTKGLHAEGGAMRLPGTGAPDWKGPSHFMTDHYNRQFGVEIRPFLNVDDNSFLHIYGHENITLKDWNANNKRWSDKFWPGWDDNLTHEMKKTLKIQGINDYYARTVDPVKDELKNDHSVQGWANWAKKWSRLSVQEFFRTNLLQDPEAPSLRPWPDQAIEGFVVSTYSPVLSSSLVEFLRDELGGWWEEPMHTPVNGMSDIPWAFIKKDNGGWNPEVWLEKDIVFGIKVEKVELVPGPKKKKKSVKVHAKNSATGEMICYEGDAVIITVSLPVIRQMDIPLTKHQEQALNFVTYQASTRVLLQYRKRFWQKDNIQGGMTRTNLPIGQIHYPGWKNCGIPTEDRGVLLVYTWGQDALIFGSQSEAEAIASAVKEVEKIHKRSSQEFEVGAVQAWFGDPAAQGAYASLSPGELFNSLYSLIEPNPPIFLAGEALSWTNGWIQGAIESGLRAAFQFYSDNEAR